MIGVPSQDYIWIMAREWNMSDKKLEEIKASVKAKNYKIENIFRVPQKW